MTKDGDRALGRDLTELFVAERGTVISLLRHLGVGPADAEDLCHDAFVLTWIARGRVRAPRAFLFGVVRRLALAYRRTTTRLELVPEASVRGGLADRPAPDTTPAADSVPAVREARAAAEVKAIMAVLTSRQRHVIDLVWLLGFTRAEAARSLGIAQSTLRCHEKMAMDAMRTGARKGPSLRRVGRVSQDAAAEWQHQGRRAGGVGTWRPERG